jgi:hypothetical protein
LLAIVKEVKKLAETVVFSFTLTKSEIDDKIKTRAAGDQLIAFFCIIRHTLLEFDIISTAQKKIIIL